MKRKVINIISILLLLVAAGCGIYLFQYYSKNAKNEKKFEELSYLIQEEAATTFRNQEEGTTENDMNSVDSVDSANQNNQSNDFEETSQESILNNKFNKKFERIYDLNEDFVGWITIKDTRVNYPVMYTPTDSEYGEYYIHRDFDEEYSASGVPFIDRNCDPFLPTDNVIIYGHNMNSGSMFHDLLLFDKKEFYDSHKTFRFDTIYGDAEYEIVSVFYGEIFDDSYTGFKYYEFVNASDENEFNSYVNNLKEMSLYDTGVNVEYGDHLLTLSTCAYHVEDGRFAIVAKRIEE